MVRRSQEMLPVTRVTETEAETETIADITLLFWWAQ